MKILLSFFLLLVSSTGLASPNWKFFTVGEYAYEYEYDTNSIKWEGKEGFYIDVKSFISHFSNKYGLALEFDNRIVVSTKERRYIDCKYGTNDTTNLTYIMQSLDTIIIDTMGNEANSVFTGDLVGYSLYIKFCLK